jgi:hypothetical protein
VGTDFSKKPLRSLFLELNKIRVEECPFSIFRQLAEAAGIKGLTAAEMKRCHWSNQQWSVR